MSSGGRVLAVARQQGQSAGPGLAVDTADAAPGGMRRFACLNPFHFRPGWRIPVPGTGQLACSVESVWQGLKLVNGATDLAMLRRPPTKRPPEQERTADFDYRASVFRFGSRTIDLVSARYLIYLPTYLYLLDRLVPDIVLREITDALERGRDVHFYDWDANFDIEDPGTSFSHSAVLAAWFGGRLEPLLERRDRWLAGAGAGQDGPLLALDRYRCAHSR
jgi:hypothetical protein